MFSTDIMQGFPWIRNPIVFFFLVWLLSKIKDLKIGSKAYGSH